MRYFIDTNLIIDIFDSRKTRKSKSDEEIQLEKEKLAPIVNILINPENEIFINNLVYLETLRTIKLDNHPNFQNLKNHLDDFSIAPLNRQIYDDAVALSRYSQSKGITISGRCAAIDLLHFSTAKYYELELLARDGDMDMLTKIYPDFLESEKDVK
jgi:predicted nucleic acid-binding protein